LFKSSKVDITKILLLLFLIIDIVSADINIIVYPLRNRSGDISIDWFGSAFVDIIIGHYKNIEPVKVYDKSKITSLDSIILGNKHSYIIKGSYNYYIPGFNVDIEVINVNNWKTAKKSKLYVETLDFADVVEKIIHFIDNFIDSVNAGGKRLKIEEGYTSRKIGQEIKQAFIEKREKVYDKISLKESYITDSDLSRFVKNFFESLYDVKIDKPIVNVDEYDDDYVNITFLIRFKVDIDRASNIIENLGYFEKSEDMESITYRISKNKILSRGDKLYKLISGKYNIYPVIYLTTYDGRTVYIIIDVPYNFERGKSKKKNIVFVTRSRPLVEIIDETNSIRIEIKREEAQVSYPFRIRKNILINLDEIRVEMLNEDKIVNLLK